MFGPATSTAPARLARSVAGLLAALSGVVLLAPAAHAAVRVSMYSSGEVIAGQVVRVTGRVSTTRNRPVQLQIKTPTGWQVAGTARTRGRAYTVQDKVSRPGTYRVVMPRARVGGRTYGAVATAARTVVQSDELRSGQTLASNQYLLSSDGAWKLTMGADGNLTLVATAKPATVVWSTNTAKHPGSRLVMQFRGNLVLVDPTGLLLWNTGTTSEGAGLFVQTDGDVVVKDGDTALWDRLKGVITPAPPVTSSSQATVRGQTWVDAKVKYSQSKYFSNKYGKYRTDCSGYVSMMWALKSSYTTRSLPSITSVIKKDQLKAGDVLLYPGSHVVLFDAWANADHTQYWAYEETPSSGAAHHVVPYPYWKSQSPSKFIPRRLNAS